MIFVREHLAKLAQEFPDLAVVSAGKDSFMAVAGQYHLFDLLAVSTREDAPDRIVICIPVSFLRNILKSAKEPCCDNVESSQIKCFTDNAVISRVSFNKTSRGSDGIARDLYFEGAFKGEYIATDLLSIQDMSADKDHRAYEFTSIYSDDIDVIDEQYEPSKYWSALLSKRGVKQLIEKNCPFDDSYQYGCKSGL